MKEKITAERREKHELLIKPDEMNSGNPVPREERNTVAYGCASVAAVQVRCKDQLKPLVKPGSKHRHYGESAARLCQKLIEQGLPMAQIGPTVKNVHWYAMKIELSEVQMALSEKTAKLLSLGMSKLDEEVLESAIRKVPFLLIAGDESMRHGDKKYFTRRTTHELTQLCCITHVSGSTTTQLCCLTHMSGSTTTQLCCITHPSGKYYHSVVLYNSPC